MIGTIDVESERLDAFDVATKLVIEECARTPKPLETAIRPFKSVGAISSNRWLGTKHERSQTRGIVL